MRTNKFYTQWIALLCGFGLFFTTAKAQQISFPLASGAASVYINGLGPAICGSSGASVEHFFGGFIINPIITEASLPSNPGSYHTMNAGRTSTIIVDIPAIGYLPLLNAGLSYAYGEAGTGLVSGLYIVAASLNPPNGFIRFEVPVTFEKGIRKGALILYVVDQIGIPPQYWHSKVTIPISVLGPTINNAYVQPIDIIVQPQIPYLILHAPPGDGSSSLFQSSKTTCRSLQTNYAIDGSNTANTAIKVGFAGSAGLFVTTDFEFSVTLNAGLEVGDMSYSATSEETCITVTEEFYTSEALDDQGGGDVFVGYGTDIALGIYEYLRLEPGLCELVLDTGLVYAPVGELRQFAKTSTGIQANIAELEAIVADSLNLEAKTVNDAMNQIDVWNQVLALNQTNINNATEPLGVTFDLDGGASLVREEAINVTQTNTIQFEHYTNFNLGVSAKVEVAGSGFEGGYEYKGSISFGETQNQSESQSKLVKYTLSDDDLGDLFRIQALRDPMYGTPIFKVDPNITQSSCPYQAGYQRDQPRLVFADGSQELTLSGIPVGGTGTFQIQICNDSDEPRTYNLYGNSFTNLDGVIVEGFGNNIFNTNDQGITFTNVPANSCLNVATLTIKQSNTNITDYEGIELFLNVNCQEDAEPISSSIFINAHFGETNGLNDPGKDALPMTIIPNPSSGQFNVRFGTEAEAGQLRLTDMTGRLLHQQFVAGGSEMVEVNQDGLAAGMYMLVFESAAHRSVQKLVVER